jgi:hypothetical protein
VMHLYSPGTKKVTKKLLCNVFNLLSGVSTTCFCNYHVFNTSKEQESILKMTSISAILDTSLRLAILR